ncbi:MAG TPA: DoxX family protein [Acidobacteriaceae bacterium]
MPASVDTTAPSRSHLWTGRVLRILAILFLLFDGVMKLVRPLPVTQAMTQLGFAQSLSIPIGVILLICTALYAIPSTSVLGAVLLTGYLGGAVVIQLRVGKPLFSTVFPILFGVLVWAGVYLLEPRLRALIPVRT